MPLSDKAKCKKVEKIFNEANVIDVNISPRANGAEVQIYIKLNSEQVVMGFSTSDIVDNPRQLQKTYRFRKSRTRAPNRRADSNGNQIFFDEYQAIEALIEENNSYPF